MTLDMGAVIGMAQSNNPDMVDKLGCFDFLDRMELNRLPSVVDTVL